MPLTFKEHINKGFVVGTWKIDESVNWLEEKFEFAEEEKQYYNKFLVDSRRKQWLSSRLLVKELDPNSGAIIYDKEGKPLFKDIKAHLSVSHSYDYASAIISYSKNVGIDIEKASERLLRVKEKFLSDFELGSVDKAQELKSLCTSWCAKEALYKLYGLRKLDFREQILIDPFAVEEKGTLKARIIVDEKVKKYKLAYQQLEEYMLVYVTE